MINLLTRRARRSALRQFVTELFRYNHNDDCWDPIGSISSKGLNRIIDCISKNKLNAIAIKQSKDFFKKREVRA